MIIFFNYNLVGVKYCIDYETGGSFLVLFFLCSILYMVGRCGGMMKKNEWTMGIFGGIILVFGIFLFLDWNHLLRGKETKKKAISITISLEEIKGCITSLVSAIEAPAAKVELEVPSQENSFKDNNHLVVIDNRPYQTFLNKRAMVVGDSMAEGLSAYGVLDSSNVVWTRGWRIDMIDQDMPKIMAYQPNYLFLSCGSNDLLFWNGNVTKFIQSYEQVIQNIHSVLPNTVVIINSVLPVSQAAREKKPAFLHQELFNTELKKLADRLRIPFLENGQYLLEHENPYSSDGIHPKVFFFHEWGKHMANYLNS